MTTRTTVAFFSLALLFLAGCDNAADRAKQAAPDSPTAPSVAPPVDVPEQPRSAPAPQGALEKPPGTDPVKLAQHAKALEELGYQAEADKLYTHACNWGHAPACERLKAQDVQLAQKETPAPTLPSPAPAKASSPTPAMMAKQETPKTAAIPAPAPAASKVAVSTPPRVAQPPLAAQPPTQAPALTRLAATAPVTATPTIAAAPASPPAPATPTPAFIAPTAKPAAPQSTPPRPSAAPEKLAAVDTQKLTQQAQELEQIGYAPVALRLYKDACMAGDGLSCKRLGEIYIQGMEGVERDYAESVRWYGRARQLGVAVPTLEKRTLYR